MTKTPFTTSGRLGLLACGLLAWAWPAAGQLRPRAASPNNPDATSHEEQEQLKINAIRGRISTGDLSALDDVAVQLGRTAAIALLSDFIMDQTREDEPLRQAVGRALSDLQAEKDFSDLITHATQATSSALNKEYPQGIRDRSRAFRALSYMRSTRSIRVLGAFLFDPSPPPAEWSADVVDAPNCEEAAVALARFGFADAPATVANSFDASGVALWRKWWTEHKAQFEHE